MRRTRLIGHRLHSGLIASTLELDVTIAGGSLTGTRTLTAAQRVDAKRTVLQFLGHRGSDDGGSSWRAWSCYLRLSDDGTTITATRDTVSSFSLTARFRLVQYKPGVIKRIQRGVVTGATATVSAVNPVIAELHATGAAYVGSSSSVGIADGWDLTLTNATTITRTGSYYVGYELVERLR